LSFQATRDQKSSGLMNPHENPQLLSANQCYIQPFMSKYPVLKASSSNSDKIEESFTSIFHGSSLVGGWPTPLKNDGVRQLGWWWFPIYGERIQSCSKPPTSIYKTYTIQNITNRWVANTSRDKFGMSSRYLLVYD
jgi:hypothetical protein